MPETTPQVLNHFALVRFTAAYWALAPAARRERRDAWLARLHEASEALHLYQGFGLEAGLDLIVWTATRAAETGVPAAFFRRLAAAYGPSRGDVEITHALWGVTRPSQYTKTRSTQELDPFAPRALPYLVMYPFTKTSEWYLEPEEERRQMMFEHIKIGKQYPEITQLLLYSTGLQDQEFVVVYETEDLVKFSKLVTELRSTAARPYTLADTPLHTAVRIEDAAELAAWL